MRKLVIIDKKNNDKYTNFLKIFIKKYKQDLKVIENKNFRLSNIKNFDVIIYSSLDNKKIIDLYKSKIIQICINTKKFFNKYTDIFFDPYEKKISNPANNKDYFFINQKLSFSEFKDITDIVSYLKWDSNFWKLNIASLNTLRITDNIIEKVNAFCSSNAINMTQFLCNCHDPISVKIAEKNLFSFKDIRLTLEKKIKADNINLIKNYNCRIAKKKDFSDLKTIISNSYVDSRYFYDQNFKNNKAKIFYLDWLRKGISGTFDDICYVICNRYKPIGYCTIKYKISDDYCSIGLFGISKKYRGIGLSKILLQYVENQMELKGKKKINVITQGRNYSAIKAYQKNGYIIKKTELWYHKWQ